MQPLVAFGVGVVGALAPEIVRLYSLRSQSGQSLSGFYFAISFLFAALGGFVAVILPATTLWGAFYAGISTPVVVSTALKKGWSTLILKLAIAFGTRKTNLLPPTCSSS